LAGDRWQETLEEGVGLGEAGAAGEGADPDGGAGAFGQGADLGEGVLVVDAGADDQGGAGAGVQAGREGGQGVRVGGEAGVHGARQDGDGGLVPVVLGDGDEHRSAWGCHRDAVGLGEYGGDVGGAFRLVGELDVGAREFGRPVGAEERAQLEQGARLLARQDHQRDAVAVGVEDGAERVADAAGRVQADERGAAGAERVARGHGDGRGLLEAEDVGEVVGPVAEHAQFGGARVAEDRGHPGVAEELDDGVQDGALHVALPLRLSLRLPCRCFCGFRGAFFGASSCR
jgi:hypothetical protein